jgi:amino acid transporter
MRVTPGEIAGERAPALRSGALSLIETAGQSLAAVGPSLTPALNISVVVAMAGVGCWLSFFLGTLGVIIVAASVSVLAVRHPEAGSYFVYIGRTFGPFTGALAGWSMISAYLFTGVATALSFIIFLSDFLAAFQITLTAQAQAATMLLYIGIVICGAYRDIRLSSRIGLLLEIISLSIMMIIMLLIVRAHGSLFDAAQLNVTALKFGGVFSALPFVIFSFVGFESSATLAKESANPKRNIPLSIMGCAAFSGVFFTLMAYFMMLGIGDDAAALAKSAAPFGYVAAKAGLAWAAMIVYFAAIISVYACTLASVNAASRLLFSMGRYQFLHRSLGHVHERYRTPHRAVLLCGLSIAALCLALRPLGYLDAFGLAGTFASFGFVVVYLGLCLVAPLDLKRANLMRGRHVLMGALGSALMLFVMVGSVYPVPEFPFNILPYVFFGYLAAGAIWFAVLKLKSPQILATIQHDMEQ